MEYDQEFENYWEKKIAEVELSILKPFAEMVWKDIKQSAKSHKPEKQLIDLQGGEWLINTITNAVNCTSSEAIRLSGLERKTEADANKSAKHMRKRDRLAAFVYEHCGVDYEWVENGNNYYLFSDNGVYGYDIEDEFPDLCKQYMPQETAIWLREKLNSGEIVL